MRESLHLRVAEAGEVGAARRAVARAAVALQFSETQAGKVALVVTEAAGNLVKHTPQGGELIVRLLERDGVGGIEILVLDSGPGMANVAEHMRDGFSTTGTAGTGMGAISRLADSFDVLSVPGLGTAVLARLWANPSAARAAPCPLEIGGVCLPKPGQEVRGDAWAEYHGPDRSAILVVDGLGHGVGANDASMPAVRAFRENAGRGPGPVIQVIHNALHGTRGAVAAVAEVSPAEGVVRYAGVGNIAGVIVSPGAATHLVSHNGTLGQEIRMVQEFTYPWPAEALLVLHSDGLEHRWNLDTYPGITHRHPALAAGILYRDFTRGRDDVTVVVAREPTKS